jgi:hypothetical protein
MPLFGGGSFGQRTDYGEHVGLFMAGLDHHEHGNKQKNAFEEVVPAKETARTGIHDRTCPHQQQPDGEQIEALERVKTDVVIAFKFAGSEDNDGGNPAERIRDIAEDGGGAGRHAGEGVGRRSGWDGTRGGTARGGCLARTAVSAKSGGSGDFTTALCAKWHGFQWTLSNNTL